MKKTTYVLNIAWILTFLLSGVPVQSMELSWGQWMYNSGAAIGSTVVGQLRNLVSGVVSKEVGNIEINSSTLLTFELGMSTLKLVPVVMNAYKHKQALQVRRGGLLVRRSIIDNNVLDDQQEGSKEQVQFPLLSEQISQAKKYNGKLWLIKQPERPLEAYSICFAKDDANQVKALKNNIEFFVSLSCTCKRFNKLLTPEKIGDLCKNYDMDDQDQALTDLKVGREKALKGEDSWELKHQIKRFRELILLCAGADPTIKVLSYPFHTREFLGYLGHENPSSVPVKKMDENYIHYNDTSGYSDGTKICLNDKHFKRDYQSEGANLFTCAHEAVHHVRGHASARKRGKEGNVFTQEKEADVHAAHMLCKNGYKWVVQEKMEDLIEAVISKRCYLDSERPTAQQQCDYLNEVLNEHPSCFDRLPSLQDRYDIWSKILNEDSSLMKDDSKKINK